jgi:hypothetical protein
MTNQRCSSEVVGEHHERSLNTVMTSLFETTEETHEVNNEAGAMINSLVPAHRITPVLRSATARQGQSGRETGSHKIRHNQYH